MTDAPEKIWLWKNEPQGELVISGPNDPHPNGSIEYTRTDVALAMVAAEREAIAKSFATDPDPRLDELFCCSAMDGAVQVCACQAITKREVLISQVLARTDADAQDALERVKREARNEALREAAERISAAKEGGTGADLIVRDWAIDAILALMEDTDDGS